MTTSACPECGAVRRRSSARGLCPRCLLRVALEESPGEPAAWVEEAGGDGAGGAAGVGRFGEYDLLSELGRGGMGIVYKARHRTLNRVVALKMLLPARLASPAQLERFRMEAEAIAALDHPGLLPVYEFGECQGQPFFTMRLAEGGSLAGRLAEEPARMDPREAARLVAQVARAVHYAHERGIQHRDLKPANILLDAAGRPYVGDFGIAKFRAQDAGLTLTNDILGTPAYLAPEQAGGDPRRVTNLADVYSLGAVLYQLLTGRPPFVAENMAALFRKAAETEPASPRSLNPAVSRDLEVICLKCLEKTPGKRHSSAEELADELGRWLAGEPVRSRPISAPERFVRWCRRRPSLAAVLAALVLAVVGGVAGVAVQWRRATALYRRQRLERYAADLQVASQALAGHDLGLARRMVAAQVPAPGEEDLRGFEWRLLALRCAGENTLTLTGHDSTVTTVCFSPDGHRVVSGAIGGMVALWDAATGARLTNFIAHQDAVWSVLYSREGDRILTVGGDAKVRFWTPEGLPAEAPLPGRGANAALSGDGSRLAVSASSPFKYFDATPGLAVWDWRARVPIFQTNLAVRRVALSADGRLLAAVGAEGGVVVWDLAGGTMRRFPTADVAWSLAFSPDGVRLAAAGFRLGPVIWDLDSAQPPLALSGHKYNLWSVAFSPDGRQLATTGSDRTVQLHDPAGVGPSRVLQGHDDEVWAAAWSADGRWLATGGKDTTIRLWATQAKAAEVEAPHAGYRLPLFSPDGRQFMTAEVHEDETRRLVLRRVTDGSPLVEFPSRGAAAFTPQGTLLLFDEHDAQLEAWSPASRAYAAPVSLAGVRAPLHPVEVVFSADAAAVAMADDKATTIWRTRDGALLAGPLAHPGPGRITCALAPGGRWLAVAADTVYEVRLHDLDTGASRRLTNFTESVKRITFSPDGALLATASVDRFVRVWGVADGRLHGELVGHVQEASDVAFSPDGRALASIGFGEGVKLWHLATMREVYSAELPEAGERLGFSPGGDLLAITTRSNTTRLLHGAFVR